MNSIPKEQLVEYQLIIGTEKPWKPSSSEISKPPLEVVDLHDAMTAMGNFENPCDLIILNRFN